MPFGLSSVPQTFTREITQLLKCIEDVFVYIKDILVASRTQREHYIYLKKLVDRLIENRICCNIEKSEFYKSKISFLDHIVSNNKIKANLSTFDIFKINTEPRTQRELKGLIGYINFFRSYIKNRSSLLAPLVEKTKLEGFVWSDTDKK